MSHVRKGNFCSPHELGRHHSLRFGEAFNVPDGITPSSDGLGENYSTIVDDRSGSIAKGRGLVALERKIADGGPDTIFACSKEDGNKVRFVDSLDDCKKKEIGHSWNIEGETGTHLKFSKLFVGQVKSLDCVPNKKSIILDFQNIIRCRWR